MQNIEVKVSRAWAKHQIDTVVRCTDKEISISMPLDEFVDALAEITAGNLPPLGTRAQVKTRMIMAATELVAQMKESTRPVMSPGPRT